MSGAMATRARPADPILSEIDLLRRMVRDRPVLQPGFARSWPLVARTGMSTEWARATLELARVNAGPACIVAFWQAAMTVAPARFSQVLAAGYGAAELCRLAGARAALACLEAAPAAVRLTDSNPAGWIAWWRGLSRLAREAPAVAAGTARLVDTLLANGDGLAFEDFVAAGLKATVRDKTRRLAFFALDDPLARTLLARRHAPAGFTDCERMLGAFIAALWDGQPRLQAAPIGAAGAPRRTTLAQGCILLPPVFPGAPAATQRDLYRAAAAHARVHQTIGSVPQPILSLRPLQRALVGLVEDARAEALAIRRLPGLRRLWSAFHVAEPGGAATAEALLARLARALLDPDYADGNGFVQKGRALFAAAGDRLEDPTVSRAIGGLLGNDLGQMRVPFNARAYVVEPAYRDDNMHLWALPETPDDSLSLTIETARAGSDGGARDRTGDGQAAPRARASSPQDRGAPLATYPEWDSVAGVERADWTTLRDTLPVLRPAPPESDDAARMRARVARLVRSRAIGPRQRQRRQEQGETLDLDAAIDAAVALQAGASPDGRVYRDRRATGRDLATLIILDVSQSTAAVSVNGQSVLESQRVAVGALAAALEAGGDRYALRAFASAGREDVRLTRLKDFDDRLDDTVAARLAGLRPGFSTRLGAALRHAGAELAPLRAGRKLVLVLTDGEPSDIDVADPRELVEDARRAVLGLRRRGIDVFGVVMDPAGLGSGAAIFGRHHALPVRLIEELPTILAGLYFRLAQR